MPKQVKGTSTNLEKLVSWDIDVYMSMSDEEDCIIFLSERDRYLLRNPLRQMKWYRRWVSEVGTPLPDISTISENLNYKLSEGACVDICDLVANCIETSDSVRLALNNTIAGNPDNTAIPEIYTESVTGLSGGCSNDVIYGYCVALWDFIDGTNKDFLEQMAEATNLSESIDRLLRLIPGFEQVPVSEVLQWISELGNYNLEAYNASYTIGVRQEIICDLYCYAIDNGCTLTLQDVYDIMLDKFGGVNFPNIGATFLEYVTFMVLGVFPTDRVVYLWTLVQLGIVFIGQKFLGINTYRPYALNAQAGEPDGDWALFCDCPQVWESVLDLTTSDFGFDFTDGQWVDGVGFKPTASTGNDNRLLAYLSIDECIVTEIRYVATITIPSNPDGNNTANFLIRNNGSNQTGSIILSYPADTPIGTTNIDDTSDGFSSTVDQLSVYLRPDNKGSAGDGTATLISLKGTGTKPSQLP